MIIFILQQHVNYYVLVILFLLIMDHPNMYEE